ncbi:MAG: hypothetical protein KC657_32655 [Myxococcales bacterium]|nr:hypothetical protein [Myxococcales bacterium]
MKPPRRRRAPKPPERPRIPLAVTLRMFAIGSVAIVAAIYAIYRHYWVPRPSMLAPVPPPTEIPAPELEPL